MERGAWRPILEGELAARAELAVMEIAEALAGHGPVPPASLAGGGPGLAVLFAYLARARPGEGHEDRASGLLDGAIDAVASAPLDASLFAGFAGVAWTVEHLAGGRSDAGDGDADDDDANE